MPNLFSFLSVTLFLSLFCSKAFSVCDKDRAIVLIPNGVQTPSISDSNKQNQPFSPIITQTISEHACFWLAVNGVNSQKTIKENSQLVLTQVLSWHKDHPHLQTLPIEIIAHGAGGLIALETISTSIKSNLDLTFSKLKLISTPLRGLEVAKILGKNTLVRDQLNSLFQKSYPSLNLGHNLELNPEVVHNLIGKLSLPRNLSIDTYAGEYQSLPEELASQKTWNPSGTLDAFSFLIDDANDGFVSTDSALYQRPQDSSAWPLPSQFHSHRELSINLNHFYQMADSKTWSGLDSTTTKEIDRKQREFFTSLLRN